MGVAIVGTLCGAVEGIIAFEDLVRGRAYFRIINQQTRLETTCLDLFLFCNKSSQEKVNW